AWPSSEDAAVAQMLVQERVHGIEIAPTKLFPEPTMATDVEIDRVRHLWRDRGLEIVAAQALLFGKPELTLFESTEKQNQMRGYLKRIIHVCSRLGAKALVFGSPKNRLAGDRDRTEVFAEAVEIFRDLGQTAADEGAAVVIEAIPPENGADFI